MEHFIADFLGVGVLPGTEHVPGRLLLHVPAVVGGHVVAGVQLGVVVVRTGEGVSSSSGSMEAGAEDGVVGGCRVGQEVSVVGRGRHVGGVVRVGLARVTGVGGERFHFKCSHVISHDHVVVRVVFTA